MLEISWLSQQVLVSQEGLGSMDLVKICRPGMERQQKSRFKVLSKPGLYSSFVVKVNLRDHVGRVITDQQLQTCWACEILRWYPNIQRNNLEGLTRKNVMILVLLMLMTEQQHSVTYLLLPVIQNSDSSGIQSRGYLRASAASISVNKVAFYCWIINLHYLSTLTGKIL
jgi:hypothetical protein